LLLAAGFLSPTLWIKCLGRSGFGFVVCAATSRDVEIWSNARKRRTLLAFGEQGSRKSLIYGQIVELPACLLAKVLVRGTRPRIGCMDAEAAFGFSYAHGHTGATQPRGRLRRKSICPE
jgi:hypothetical protein